MKEKKYLAFLHSIGFTQKKLEFLFWEHDNYKEVFENLSTSFLEKIGFSLSQREKIMEKKEKLDTQKIEKILENLQVSLITKNDKDYPESLKEVSQAPFLLYVRGHIDNAPKLAIIGSRKVSEYGKKIIERFTPAVSKYFTIVSGGAMWCDTLAHNATIKAGRKTIIVVGTGIDICYPATNKMMGEKAIECGGAIISLFPIWEPPNPYNFPIRNEIIAWLSHGTIVVEAWKKSGTLITAGLALEQGRDVFAFPWDIYKLNSEGCNMLIKTGQAKLVSELNDILEEYNIASQEGREKKIPNFTNQIEKQIYDALLLEWLTIDALSKKLQLSTSELSTHLSFLEIQWYIRRSLAGKYELL